MSETYDIIEKLKIIKEKLENEAHNIINYIVNLSKNTKGNDDFNSEILIKKNAIECNKFYKKNDKEAGLYIFVVNNAFSINKKTFNSVDYGAKIKKNEKAVNDNIDLKEGDIFYLGSSQNIYDRLNEHLFGESSTYSLKLDAQDRKDCKKHLTIYPFILSDNYNEYMDIILPQIEAWLHKELKPIVGSART